MTLPSITFLSEPMPVSMGDAWYDIVSLNHFWIRRRFEVLQHLTGTLDWGPLKVGEIGCGNGMVQRQFELLHQKTVDGFDLNLNAMEASHVQQSHRFCYDIHARQPSLKEAYDALILFDVLEHIDDDAEFLASSLYHLKPGGHLLINVPALQSLYSSYDVAAGHVRRYDAEALKALVEKAGMTVRGWTFWGKPMLPLLQWRRHRLKGKEAGEALRDGFDSRGELVNAALLALARLEWLPHYQSGTSLMLWAEK